MFIIKIYHFIIYHSFRRSIISFSNILLFYLAQFLVFGLWKYLIIIRGGFSMQDNVLNKAV